jgi:chromate transporter
MLKTQANPHGRNQPERRTVVPMLRARLGKHGGEGYALRNVQAFKGHPMSSASGGSSAPVDPSSPPAHPTFGEALRVWLRIGLLSFGGPAGQIALMHRELVEKRRWISESRFLHALNYCMLLPGPEAQQLATYVGWLLHGWRGGVVAGVLFVLPGFFVILALASLYALHQNASWAVAIFFGLKAAVLAIVLEAVWRVGRRALKTGFAVALAAGAFVALFALDAPFPLVVVAAGALGFILPHLIASSAHGAAGAGQDVFLASDAARAAPTFARAVQTIALWGGIWLAPFLLILALGARQSVYGDIAVFFSKMAVVTFGGAYAVLAYVAQQAVESLGWLAPGEMLDGLALAETTPGPLILVLTFVGFLAAFRLAPGLDPMLAGALGATLATWVTFAPCFLWIFLGAPYVERLRADRKLAGALGAITAAVVGVILNLAIWFALHVLFRDVGAWRAGPLSIPAPDLATANLPAFALSAVAALALFRFKLSVPMTLALCAALGASLGATRLLF